MIQYLFESYISEVLGVKLANVELIGIVPISSIGEAMPAFWSKFTCKRILNKKARSLLRTIH